MAKRLGTILLTVVAGTILVAGAAPASAGADLGDVLGVLSGGQGAPPAGPTPTPPSTGGTPSSSGPAQPKKHSLLATGSSCPGQTDPRLSLAAQERVMACMLNYARAAKGHGALRFSKPLHRSATHKAHDIKRCHQLSHEACGRDFFYWIARAGFLKGTWEVGEILADGGKRSGSVRATMRAWLGSTTHREVLLHGAFNRVGVGLVTGRFRGYRHMRIWVAHLGDRH
jgi:uncharacterized protein YkwD